MNTMKRKGASRVCSFIIAMTFLFPVRVSAQTQSNRTWEKYIDDIGTMDDVESSTWTDAYDNLSELYAHPMDINTATREDLQQMPFLTAQQIEDICAYVYQYGGMKTLGELAMVESLDYATRKALACFVYAGAGTDRKIPTFAEVLKRGKNDVAATLKVPFYSRHGDENGYLGYKYKHSVRYTFRYGDMLKFGILGSQDAGEPLFADRNKWGYDFYSFYLIVKKIGALKALAVGRYRLSFGMGLVMNNDFGLGKIATLSTLGRSTNNIRAHSSRSAANYLQGVAATVQVAKGLDVSGFVSYRDIDATLNKDDGSIRTILYTGYHRTPTEMEKKDNASQFLAGGNVHYFVNGWHVGATGIYTSFNKELKPDTRQTYRRYRPSGDRFFNVSADYGYTGHRLSFNGETATGDCHSVATINTLSYQLTGTLTLMALQRFYSYKYYSLFAESFSEGGSVQNESGVYLGVNWRASRHLSLMAYSDYAYFPWARYQVYTASHAWDNLVQAVYASDGWSVTARYRFKTKEINSKDKLALISRDEHRGRLGIGYDGRTWSTKTQADVSYMADDGRSFGWMVSENVGVACKGWLKFNASIGYFNTDDYDSRIYTYEKGMLYEFPFMVFYGEGIRYSLLANASVSSKLMFTLKVATTDYFDRNHISSGKQQIDRSAVTDMEMQLRWQF